MPRVGAYTVRSRSELEAAPSSWMSSGEESVFVQIGVVRWVVSLPVRGELLGPVHLLMSPPQVREFILPEPVEQAELAGILSELLIAGYQLEVRPVDVPVTFLEFMVLRGELEPDAEPVEGE